MSGSPAVLFFAAARLRELAVEPPVEAAQRQKQRRHHRHDQQHPPDAQPLIVEERVREPARRVRGRPLRAALQPSEQVVVRRAQGVPDLLDLRYLDRTERGEGARPTAEGYSHRESGAASTGAAARRGHTAALLPRFTHAKTYSHPRSLEGS